MPATEGSELRYLEFRCPACNAPGRLPIARMSGNFTCQQCGKPFYLDTEGPVAGRRKRQPRQVGVDYTVLKERPPGLAERVWVRLPREGRTAVVGAIALCCVAVLLRWAVPRSEGIAASLQERARVAGEAVLRNQTGPLKELAASGTGGDAVDWLRKVRPRDWTVVEASSAVDVRTQTLFQNSRVEGGRVVWLAAVVLHLSPPGAKAAGEPLELATFWTRVGEGEWYLDGKRTKAGGQ